MDRMQYMSDLERHQIEELAEERRLEQEYVDRLDAWQAMSERAFETHEFTAQGDQYMVDNHVEGWLICKRCDSVVYARRGSRGPWIYSKKSTFNENDCRE